MRAAPEDLLTSLFCARRILVSVRERITTHFLFECHYATLQMFERTCADSFVQIAQVFARCELSGCPVSLIGNSRASVTSMFALACFRAVTLRTATAPLKRQAIHSETLSPLPRVLYRPASVRHAKAARP